MRKNKIQTAIAGGLIGAMSLTSGCSQQKPNAGDDVRYAGSAMNLIGRAAGSSALRNVGGFTGILGGALGVIIDIEETRRQNAANLSRVIEECIQIYNNGMFTGFDFEQKAQSKDFDLRSMGPEVCFTCSRWEDGLNGCAKDGLVDPSGKEFVNLGKTVYDPDEQITFVHFLKNRFGARVALQLQDVSTNRTPNPVGFNESKAKSNDYVSIFIFNTRELRPGPHYGVWMFRPLDEQRQRVLAGKYSTDFSSFYIKPKSNDK